MPDPNPDYRRVVVADDNEDGAESLAMVLAAHGIEVRTAYDGAVALQMIDAWRPDAAVVDIGLPTLSGYEVAQRVRARHGAAMLLVTVTGWDQPKDRAQALAAGFDHHLVKPEHIEPLLALLGKRPGGREP